MTVFGLAVAVSTPVAKNVEPSLLIFSVELAAFVQIVVAASPPVTAPVPLKVKVPLFVTVVAALMVAVLALPPTVKLAVAAIVLLPVRVNAPVFVTDPVPSSVQLAVPKVMPPEPLNVPLIVNPLVVVV